MSLAWSPLLRSATVLLMLKNSRISADLFSFSSLSPLRARAILRMALRYSIRVGLTFIAAGNSLRGPRLLRRGSSPVFLDELGLDPLDLVVGERVYHLP